MSKNNESKEKIVIPPKKNKKSAEMILRWDSSVGLLIPMKWHYPYLFRKKDYYAFIIGLNKRFEFERSFIEKIEYEQDHEDSRDIGVGFNKIGFKDGLILEEKYSYKKDNTFFSATNYWEILLMDDGVWGYKITKTEIKDILGKKQIQIYEKFNEIIQEFGEDFTLLSMESAIKKKKHFNNLNLFFL
jgi:hypothetical protein